MLEKCCQGGLKVLESLITSKTRVKLIVKFFANGDTQAYLRGLAEEFKESTNGIRVELNRLHNSGLLVIAKKGRVKLYQANKNHPLFKELQQLVLKYLGIEHVAEFVSTYVERIGSVERVYIIEDYAKGIDFGTIEIVLIGKVDIDFFQQLITKVEKVINRKIRYLIISKSEFASLADTLKIESALLVWSQESKLQKFCGEN